MVGTVVDFSVVEVVVLLEELNQFWLKWLVWLNNLLRIIQNLSYLVVVGCVVVVVEVEVVVGCVVVVEVVDVVTLPVVVVGLNKLVIIYKSSMSLILLIPYTVVVVCAVVALDVDAVDDDKDAVVVSILCFTSPFLRVKESFEIIWPNIASTYNTTFCYLCSEVTPPTLKCQL